MHSVRKPGWQQATALVSLSAGGAITGFSFVPKAPTDLTSPAGMPVHLLALEQAAKPAAAGGAALRPAIVNVARYYLRLSASKSPAEMEALIWQHDSLDGADHGESCAAFASLTLELAAHAVGQQSWVTGGTSYPWPLHKWADARVDPNPASLGIVSILQDAQAHHRWHPLGDGYQPLPGDWVLFDGHVEVVTRYAQEVLHTIGGDSLPNFSVNAHRYAGSLAAQGVAGFVNNGDLGPADGATADGGSSPARRQVAGPAPHAGTASRLDRVSAGKPRGPASREAPGAADIPGAQGPPAGPGGPAGAGRAAAARPTAGRPPQGRPAGGRPAGARPAGARPAGARPAGGRAAGGRAAGGGPPGGRAAGGHAAGGPGSVPGGADIPGLPASGAAPVQPTGRFAPPATAPAPRERAPSGAPQDRTPSGAPRERAPSGAPQHPQQRPPGAMPGDSATRQAFIHEIAPLAVSAERTYGVPAAVTIAQAIEESGWGQSALATGDHNLFGMKGSGPAGTDPRQTREFENGRWVTLVSPFRVYHNIAESVDDHGRLLATSGYYRHAMTLRHDPNAFANALTGVYATDPQYGAKLIALMRQYDLYRYDGSAPAAPPRTQPSGSAAIPGLPRATPIWPAAGSPHSHPATASRPRSGRDAVHRPGTPAAPAALTAFVRQPAARGGTSGSPAASRYVHRIPTTVKNAFTSGAKVALERGEAVYMDVADHSGIRWELLAACDWMQCRARPRYSPVNGEKLGTENLDGTLYRTKSEALEQCADDLVKLAHVVYGVDVGAPRELSVSELARVFAAFRWGGLLKLHRTSAMEFPYSVAGLTIHHTNMRWPHIAEPNAPDRPGARFRMPFGAVPAALLLGYPATV